MEAHEIVGQVHEVYKGITKRLARASGKAEEWFRSHHREPKTRNAEASGNTSPVTHFIEYCHQYEAVEPGSGRMLNNRVHQSLNAEFDEMDGLKHDTHDHITNRIFDEEVDVHKWLAQFDLDSASVRQLDAFERDAMGLVESVQEAISKARSCKRQRQSEERRAA